MKTFGSIRWETEDDWYFQPGWRIKTTPAVMMRLKRILPRVASHRTGEITIGDTPEVARDLTWILDRWPMEISRSDRRRLNREARLHRDREKAIEEILTGGRSLDLALEVEGARDYQLVAADLALNTGRLLLADDLGLGKTLSSLLMFRDPETLPALIVTMTHLPRQWQEELNRWFPMLKSHILRKTVPYDPASTREMRGHDPDVLITSYSKLFGWADHLAGKVNTVIFDEVQELRREGSAKYIAAGQIADQAQFKMGLSATPVYNYGGEIFNILSILAPDALGSRGEFNREWGLAMGSNGQMGVNDPAELGSHLRDEGLLLRRTRADVSRELPEVVRVTHSIDSDESVVDALSGDAIDLARMILDSDTDHKEVWKASGDFDWKLRHATGVGKAPYVADFVRMLVESGEKVVLYGWHHDVYDIWEERLEDLRPVRYTGKESPNQKNRARDFFLGKHGRVMMMSLRSGAGLDGLQEASHVVVFGELDWSPGVHDQCIGRLHRDGQEGGAVMAYFLVSDQGADPVMADVLNLKRQQGEQIRDPDADLVAPVTDTSNRVRLLAEEYVRRQGAGQPAPPLPA